ncbi:U6 snRNA-associated Sm-like protein LSm8 [Pavlovales sp. CCMP2436]|nr:U6 snRNA-associated Sm-like protein LSm8 [Pavlovales sp. CCMP2436]
MAERGARAASAVDLESVIGKPVHVVTNDGRNIVGVLKGYDQKTNVILDESHERVQVPLGLYIVRGDNIAVIGEIDEEIDAEIDLSTVAAEPLKAIVH